MLGIIARPWPAFFDQFALRLFSNRNQSESIGRNTRNTRRSSGPAAAVRKRARNRRPRKGIVSRLLSFRVSDQIGFGTKGQKRTAHGGKEWTWTRPFARPRPSSTSNEGGFAVPNSRLITAVIWISRTPMDTTGPLGSTQTTTTATAMRQRQGHRETKRAPRGKWNGRRVEGDGNFGAQ